MFEIIATIVTEMMTKISFLIVATNLFIYLYVVISAVLIL